MRWEQGTSSSRVRSDEHLHAQIDVYVCRRADHGGAHLQGRASCATPTASVHRAPNWRCCRVRVARSLNARRRMRGGSVIRTGLVGSASSLVEGQRAGPDVAIMSPLWCISAVHYTLACSVQGSRRGHALALLGTEGSRCLRRGGELRRHERHSQGFAADAGMLVKRSAALSRIADRRPTLREKRKWPWPWVTLRARPAKATRVSSRRAVTPTQCL